MKMLKPVENLINICQTCLSNDRLLVSTSELRYVLKEIKLSELASHEFKALSKLLHVTKNNFDFELVHNFDALNNTTIPIEIDKREDQRIKLEEVDIDNIPTPDYDSDDDKKLQVFVDILKKNKEKEEPTKSKPSSHIKKKKKEDQALLKEKFETVLLTDKEVLKSREEKRNHPNFKKVPFKCDLCVLGFTKMVNYDLHFEKYHNQTIGSYICEVCSTVFATKSSLERHKNKHYLNYVCKLCEYKTSALKAAVNHCKDKHALDEKDKIHCKQCEAVFRSPDELAKHMKMDHLLQCNDCGEKFKGKHTLRTHKKRIHAVKREFACEMCSRSFLTKSRLESHMIKHGQTVARRLAYCTLCRVQYKNIQVYRSHVKNSVEHSQNRYQCPECNKKFASKVYWTQHYNFYHLKKTQYKCESCNMLFISKWRLKNHKQKHHGLNRPRDHGCNQCEKKFYTLTTLRGHLLTHSEQRLYMCSDCGDTFKQRAALYTHERRVHKGNGDKKGDKHG